MRRRYEKAILVAILLLAFALRVWQLDGVPPGWRDDELINSLVISQKVIDGDWQLYYADASGHEALYHALNGGMLALFGANILGIRLLSVFLGLLTIPLTWLLGRKLFGSTVGLLAAAALALSFWSLMYSRIGIRHILMPVTMLFAFTFFWRGLTQAKAGDRSWGSFVAAGLFIGLGFYVYFASRGVPLILLVFVLYMFLVARPWLRRAWRGAALMFALAVLLALPLFVTLNRQPESEARVEELAVPLIAAQAGDLQPLTEHVLTTLSMFHADGDDEWLYNIPHRALFGPAAALFFWLGVLIATYYAVLPVLRWLWGMGHGSFTLPERERPAASLPAAFLLLWWLAGISPGFISVPPASLGHTILAQPVTFILLVLPIWQLQRLLGARVGKASGNRSAANWLLLALSLLLLVSIAGRDLADYFGEWPQRGMVRFLYRADIDDVAKLINENGGPADFAVAGLLAGPWDALALEMGLDADSAVAPRWYHPERAIFLQPALSLTGNPRVTFAYEDLFQPLPAAERPGAFQWSTVGEHPLTDAAVCFENGLCALAATFAPESGLLELDWYVDRSLDLPPFQLISNPPPPDVYAGPRLAVFGQMLDNDGGFVAGDDGLWVDAYRLQPGDVFRQQHRLPAAAAVGGTIVFGLYDPMTGARLLTADGRDHLRLEVEER